MPRIALLLAVVASLCIPTPASALIYGMGNEDASMFSSPLFADLHLTHTRYVVAYDAALSRNFERQQADAYLRDAHAQGFQILVSFEHSRLRSKARELPSQAAYARGVRAFMKRYPYVRTFSPWDEINDCSQPTCRNPKAAAGYYKTLKRLCRQCTVMAAEVLDSADPDGLTAYLQAYQRAVAPAKPRLWGLHNYSDVNRFRSTGTRIMLKAVKGSIWLTETGGLYSFKPGFPPSTSRQARAEQQMFKVARISPRIKRLYIYSWTGGGTFDAGLMNANGTPRPAYDVVKQHVR